MDTCKESTFHSTLACLYKVCLSLPLFHINDIFVSGFAAEKCGFKRKHDQRFSAGKKFQFFKVKFMQSNFNSTEGKSVHFYLKVLVQLFKGFFLKKSYHFRSNKDKRGKKYFNFYS